MAKNAEKLKIGIIGCGVIGSEIATACKTLLKDKIELAALCDIDGKKSLALSRSINKEIVADSIEEVFARSDLIVEAASRDISRDILKIAIEKAKDVLIMSVGGLIESEDLLRRAREKNIKVYLPSGALCGIDGLKAAGISDIDSVTLTTRKPPKGLEGAPFLRENRIDINSIKAEKILFEGNPIEAIKGFPKNINVASILSLAGIGARRTAVRIVVSPAYTKNTHEVEIKGAFGVIRTKTENVPSEKNPKTSKLAILSAIATLRGIVDSVRMGT